MTTRPKARRYRIRPDMSLALPRAEGNAAVDVAAVEAEVAAPAAPAPAAAASEEFTGRQLRLARRIAQKNGIVAATDREAVDKLRAAGIDPFDRSNAMALVPAAQAASTGGSTALAKIETAQVPAHRANRPAAPAPGAGDAERADAIQKIQRDIARRRRRRLALLGIRLGFFVGLPTLVAGFYFYVMATPMYATQSEIVIQQADAASAAGAGIGGLFSGTGLATQQDSIGVQSYLLSRTALERLDADLGFTAHFSDPTIDPLQRLEPDATQEDAYALYKRKVSIGYDPTEGLIKMEVVAADPATSAAFSEALIGYAEEEVDQLTARLRADQMAGAEQSFERADARMREAQDRVVDLQETLGVVSAEAELSSRYQQIGAIETELRAERLRLDGLQSVQRPNRSRVEVAQRNIQQLEAELAVLRDGLTESRTDDANLARVTAELGVAQIDLETRQLLLQQAAQQMEMARIEANRQTRYLSTPVPPTPPDEATYPRSFENTALAFLVFAGIYLMLSLTAAILREQVSS
ncbi:capsule biosynthesis protein [Jannaschia sp. Os4]|uniref:capsule biosynthesis protein n=1 Tax=Jannaschia sp. Os4 TaxID=2807617 RepID=UPI001939A23D|nr:capsule biosynthesis protein [Jannaschia sp. Os4]MBM2576785.1 capsule biosynthesis protein [Jannaschia sp. Os4]